MREAKEEAEILLNNVSNVRKVIDLIGGGKLYRCDSHGKVHSFILSKDGKMEYECERVYENDMLVEYAAQGQLIDPRA